MDVCCDLAGLKWNLTAGLSKTPTCFSLCISKPHPPTQKVLEGKKDRRIRNGIAKKQNFSGYDVLNQNKVCKTVETRKQIMQTSKKSCKRIILHIPLVTEFNLERN